MNRTSRIGTVVVAIVACSTAAQAGDRAQLVVTRDPSAAECPDERAIRDAVGARLGYEPFTADAPSSILVLFRREGALLRGTVRMRGVDGQVKGERTFTSARGDCEELASATTLTISILLDPRSGIVPPRRPDPELVPEVTETPVARVSDPLTRAGDRPASESVASPLPAPSFSLRLTAAALASLGTSPAPAAGVLVGAGVERGRWSAAAELRADAPASDVIDARAVRAHFVGGNLVPCGHVWKGYACAVLALGVLQGEILGASPSRQATFHAMIGPRFGLSLPLAGWLSLDGHVDGSYALTTTTLRVADTDVWATSTLSGLVAIGLVGRFR